MKADSADVFETEVAGKSLQPISEKLAHFAVKLSLDEIPEDSLRVMTFSIFDWACVGHAGKDEPVSRMIRNMVAQEEGISDSGVFGHRDLLPARAAALSNGTISHALDYDDTHFDYIGHPSVVVVSAALALSEKLDASGRDFAVASLIGAEAACRIGTWLGRNHYQAGFHQTSTSGCFGAVLAGCRILGLDESQTMHALGLATTRASGLKSQFGTMGKPYNAGMAASNAVEAVLLAKSGFVSRSDGLECAQGFAETHSGEFKDSDTVLNGLGSMFVFEQVQHKLHACCHGLHASIEAISKVKNQHGIESDEVKSVTISTNPRWLKVCNIECPETGLEAKFSFKQTAAMALEGINTGKLDVYSEGMCKDQRIAGIRKKVIVEADEGLTDSEAQVRIEMVSGEPINCEHELAEQLPLDRREQNVRKKGAILMSESKANELWSKVESLPSLTESIRKLNLTSNCTLQ